MTGLLINAVILAVLLNFPDAGFDYQPKELKREIEKLSGCSKPLSEVFLPDKTDIAHSGRFFKYSNAEPVRYAYIGRVFTCRAEGCSATANINSGDRTEFFDYFILYGADARILSVQVFNYEATHGHGITVKSWLKQFIGFHGEKSLNVGKEIDAIAGATISVHSITDDITERTRILKEQL